MTNIQKVAVIRWAEWFRDGEAFPIDETTILRKDQLVIVEHPLGIDIGRVRKIRILNEEDNIENKKIIRVANEEDRQKYNNLIKEAKFAYNRCRELILEHNLEMKLVRAYYSFDDKRLTFTFISNGRVDFRDLVRDLSREFHKLIRLQQIGIRDEARLMGDLGPCGRALCCANHLEKLESISSDLIELQQLNHRGSDRLSGMCGRLACCLAYEKNTYETLKKNLPKIGDKVQTKEGNGVVISQNILKQTIKVNLDDKDKNGIIELSINDILKK